mgnify:CR=1 FL=1
MKVFKLNSVYFSWPNQPFSGLTWKIIKKMILNVKEQHLTESVNQMLLASKFLPGTSIHVYIYIYIYIYIAIL